MSDMSMNQRRDDWQAGVLGDLTGTPQAPQAPQGPQAAQSPQDAQAPQGRPAAHGLQAAEGPHASQAQGLQAYEAPQAGPLPVQPHAPLPQQQPAQQPQQPAQQPHQPAQQPQQAYARQPYTPQAPQARAPETVPVPGSDTAAGRPRHGDPLARRTLRTLRGALGSSVAKAVAAETELATQVQQPVTTGRQIVVTSIRGGSGKTTVTALLSRTYNHFRHDPVLTLEADAALGTLPVRLGVQSLRWTCADLAQIVRPSMQLTDITGYLVPLPDGGWLLPGSQGRIGAQVDVATYRTVMVALRRYFGVTVVDCETLPGDVARTALDTAHARVLTAPATAEGLVSTHAVLDWLGSLPVPVLPRTVVVLTVQAPHPAVDLGKAVEKLRATGAGVVVLPYDRHLASGGAVKSELLAFETREAAMRLAADVLQRAVALPASGGSR
ncbi:hypothetical protein ACFVHW_19470 [Streptomyces sp. NPDC127110]|uniref:MinD/ParA family ATP-binding protein n=1 Tax=Streptomyces sp. NPDC127110 TaxID=3345362 RepID=UPI003629F441